MGGFLNSLGDSIRLLILRIAGRLRPPIHPPWHVPVISTPLRAEGWDVSEEDGLHDHNYPYSGVALLNTFYFLMTRGQTVSSTIDHHLQQIMFLLDFGPDTLHLGFHDEPDNDTFRYVIAHHAVEGEDIRIGEYGLDIGVGTYSVQLGDRPAGDWVFVLRGFQLSFRGVDHHINEIGIRETNGTLRVAYSDRNADDTYVFTVQYAWVPAALLDRLGSSSGTSAEWDRETIPNGRVVLRGFHFDFRPIYTAGGDHHIKEVGVLGGEGRIDVVYSDKNGDDGFDWLVNWGLLSEGHPDPLVEGRRVQG